MKKNNIIAVLDIGSAKIACAVGKYNPSSGKTEILAFAHHMSKGVKNGKIISTDQVSSIIIEVLSTVEEASGINIDNIIISVAGGKIFSEMLASSCNINNQQIKDKDIKKIIKQALDRIDQESYEILHYIPTEFKVDDIKGVINPIGMVCRKLTAYINVILVPVSIINNLENCLARCQLNISDLVVSVYAAGLGVLTQEEKDQGITLIDIGAAVTSVAIYHQGIIKYIKIIPIGSQHITNDLAVALRLNFTQAEKLKIIYGSLDIENINLNQVVNIEELIGKEQTIESLLIYEVICARIDEIIEYLLKDLKDNKYFIRSNSVVITGGGAKLNGLDKYMTYKLDKKVSIGYTNYLPNYDNSEMDLLYNPEFSNLIGLVNYYTRKQNMLAEYQLQKSNFNYNNRPFLKIFNNLLDKFKNN